MNGNNFHHPYQFIPATGRINGILHRYEFEPIRKGTSATHARHDLGLKGSRSGRFVCRLELKSPTVVGAEQAPGSNTAPSVVHQNQRNGQPALPANSLRGMVASVAETLSQSSLRILENKMYSVRKPADSDTVLKLLGELVPRNEGWGIRPVKSAKIPSGEARNLFNRAVSHGVVGDRPRFYARIGPDGLTEGPVTEAEWRTKGSPNSFVEGRLRVLDAPSDQLPTNRISDLFVYGAGESSLSLEIPPKVLKTFQEIVREREEATRHQAVRQPFRLLGEQDWKPCEGLTLYYRLERNGVAELAPSTIWRLHSGSGSFDFFRSIDKDLLPWGQPLRGGLTPAELLFGVVSAEADPDHAQNLASRIRFGDALPPPDREPRQMAPVTLKILASPKPPSPSMYFHPTGDRGTWIDKTRLHKNQHLPNGRKIYLHHPPDGLDDKPWETRHPTESLKQKLSCRPLCKGEVFYFTIEFENLSDPELTLLKTALEPTEGFQHRLGLGKSLGLGSVKTTIEALFLIDRGALYGPRALNQPRYSRVVQNSDPHTDWHGLLPMEAHSLDSAEAAEWNSMEDKERLLIDSETHGILAVAGDPTSLQEGIAIKPPMLRDQTDPEHETFKWFMENDKRFKLSLGPITSGHKLPTLTRDGRRPVPPPESEQSGREVQGNPAAEWLNAKIETLKQGNLPMHLNQALWGKSLAIAWRDELGEDPEKQSAVKRLIRLRWGEEKWNDPVGRSAEIAREIYG
jgi:hypothetical protein